jgi:hypothetical protein
MWGQIDIAAIKATLGFDEWVDEEDALDVTFLADKMCSGGLTASEQVEYEALQALYCSGR